MLRVQATSSLALPHPLLLWLLMALQTPEFTPSHLFLPLSCEHPQLLLSVSPQSAWAPENYRTCYVVFLGIHHPYRACPKQDRGIDCITTVVPPLGTTGTGGGPICGSAVLCIAGYSAASTHPLDAGSTTHPLPQPLTTQNISRHCHMPP